MAVPAKPYELTFDERPKYLFVQVSTEVFSVDVALAYLREVISECRELNYERVLIVRDIPIVLSADRNSYVGSKLKELAFEGLKIAVVEPNLNSRQRSRFSSAASLGFGIEVKVHSSIPDARRWLVDD